MQYLQFFITVCLATFLLAACNDLNSASDTDLQIEGKVTYMEIEGGFWAIESADETYEPTNLPEEFQKDGLKVRVYANVAEEKASIRMVGPIIHIEKILKR